MLVVKVARRRLFALLVAPVITLGGLLVSPGAASAADFSNISIVSARSGMCLNLARWDTSDGAAIIQWPCGEGNNEKWNLTSKYPDGSIPSVVSQHSGKCLDITGASNGKRVTQQGCYYNNNGHQGWALADKGVSNGWRYFTFENVHAKKCLDVPNGTMDSGAAIQVWDCNGSQAQLWRIPA